MFWKTYYNMSVKIINETIRVTKGHGHFSRGEHVGQPWFNIKCQF